MSCISLSSLLYLSINFDLDRLLSNVINSSYYLVINPIDFFKTKKVRKSYDILKVVVDYKHE